MRSEAEVVGMLTTCRKLRDYVRRDKTSRPEVVVKLTHYISLLRWVQGDQIEGIPDSDVVIG